MTPAAVRDHLVDPLRQDLVGPALPDELLVAAPTRWYPTGFLAPLNASPDQPIGTGIGGEGPFSTGLIRVGAFAGRYV